MSRFVGIFLWVIFFWSFAASQGWPDQDVATVAIDETLNDFDDAFSALKQERDALRQEINGLKTEQRALLDGARNRIESVEGEKDKYSEALETAEEKIADLELEKRALADKLEDTKIGSDKVSDIINAKDSAVEELNLENEQLMQSRAQAERALEKAAARIQKLQEEKESLAAEIDALREERKKVLFGYDDDLETIRQERDRLTSEIKSVREKLSVAQEKISEFDKRQELSDQKRKEELSRDEASRKETEEKLAQAEKEQKDLLKSHQDELARLKDKTLSLENASKELGAKKDAVERKLTLAEEKLKFYEVQIAEAKKEKEAWAIKQKDETAASSSLLADVTGKLKESQDKLKLSEDRSKFAEQKLKDVEEKFSKTSQELKDINAQLADVSTKYKANQKSKKTAGEILASLKENVRLSEEKRKAAEEKIEVLGKQVQALSKEKKDADNILSSTQEKLAKAEQKLKEEEEKLRQVLSQRGTVAKEYETALVREQTAQKIIQEQLKARTDDLAASRKEFMILLKERSDWVTKMSRLEVMIADLTARLAGAEQGRDSAKKELAAMRAELENLSKVLGQTKTRADRLSSENLELIKKKEEWAQGLTSAEQGRDSAKKELAAMRAELENLSKALGQTKTRADLLSSENLELIKKKEGLAQGLTSGFKEAAEKAAKLKEERDGLAKKVDALNTQLLEYSKALTKNITLEKENKLMKAGMDNMVKSLNESEAKYQALVAASQKDKETWLPLQKEYKESLELVQQAKNIKSQNDSLVEAVRASETKLKKLLDSFVKMQQENEQLREDAKAHINPRDYKDTMQKNTTLEAENAALKKDVKKFMETLSEMQLQNKEIFKEKLTKEQKLARMDTHLKTWDQEKKEWTKTQEEAQAALKDKEGKLDDISEQLRKVLAENKRLKERVASFPNELAEVSTKIEKLRKENTVLHYNLGVIYTEKDLYEDAVKEFEKALQLTPDDPACHYNLGIIYSQYIVDEDKAVMHFKNYLKIAPNDKDADQARRYIFMRSTYESDEEK